jgi:hypothetical protein
LKRIIVVAALALSACSVSGLAPPTAPAPLPATTPASIRLTAASRPDRSVGLTATVLTADGRFVSHMVVTFSASSGTITPIEVQTDEAGVARSILTPDTSQTVAHVQAGALHASVDVLSAAPVPPTPPTPPPPSVPDPIFANPSAFSTTPGHVCLQVGTPIQFHLSTIPWNLSVRSSLWAFGDGSTSPLRDPQHTYTAAQWVNVFVTISTSDGRSTTGFIVIQILGNCSPAI